MMKQSIILLKIWPRTKKNSPAKEIKPRHSGQNF